MLQLENVFWTSCHEALLKITNRYGLPEAIVRGARIQNAKYDKGNSQRSATQLIRSPRIDILREAHFHEMETDISDDWWALFGSAVHHILEMGKGPNQIVEERLFLDVSGWTISGQADIQEAMPDGSISISDYKVTTAFAITVDGDDGKPEWEAQLNILAYLVEKNKGIPVSNVEIVAIVRDWQRREAQADPTYPIAPVVRLPMRLWSMEEREAYILERVAMHQEAAFLHAADEDLPLCTDKDRWMRGEKWAVQKPNAKRATRVFDTQEEAWEFLKEKDDPKYEVVHNTGRPVRCEGNYCGVAEWCSQYQRELNNERTERDVS